MLRLRILASYFFISFACTFVFADTKITILHTGDLHSHFTNEQSTLGLGGMARLKTKIDEIRNSKPNTLLLDAGDWSEGTIFFTLNSGEASQRIMNVMGYDAMVLGNHDWLVGPKELHEAFRASGLRVPVLSANLDFSRLPADLPLNEDIKPYVIKEIDGVRVGIFGLSTFQIVYDHFFAPVKLINPFTSALKTASYLRNHEKCDVVILLSHLGFPQDKLIADTVSGIDLIVGGHTHVLLKKPVIQRGVPIVHVGKWGEYLGEYELTVSGNGTRLTSHTIHPIDSTIAENADIQLMVNGFTQSIENKFGTGFFKKDKFFSEVNLQTFHEPFVNDFMGQMSVDAMREATGADLALDSQLFSSSFLFKGWSSLADLFNIFPHIFTRQANSAWHLYTYKVNGFVLKSLVSLFVKAGMPLQVSNAYLQIDFSRGKSINEFKINGENVSVFKQYTVVSTDGILDFFKKLSSLGLPIGPKTWTDTNLEAWRVAAKKMVQMSPLKVDQVKLEARFQSVQPDLHICQELFWTEDDADKTKIKFKVWNAGLTATPFSTVSLKVTADSSDFLADQWRDLSVKPLQNVSEIPAGGIVTVEADWPKVDRIPGTHRFRADVEPAPTEKVLTNNLMKFQLPSQ